MTKDVVFRKRCKDLLYLACGLALYCLLALFFHIPCPIKWFTGISCPGCGMTRSLLALCRFDLGAAIAYHPLIFWVVAVAPALVVCYLKDLVKIRKALVAVSAVLLIGVYLYRMILLESSVLVFAPENGAIPRLVRWVAGLLG